MGYFAPQTMRDLDQWIVWRLEPGRGSKPDKIPYSPKTGRKASTTDRRTWGSYGEALNMQQYGDFDGIGFVFSRSTGLVFIDLDDCIDDSGEISQFATDVLTMFPDCYTEYSQSGNGLHIICKGTLPEARKTKEIEMYSWGRYVAFTGNAVNDVEPGEAQASINTLFARYARTEPPEAPQQTRARTTTQSVDDIIEIIYESRQGEKFARLMQGNITGYPSQSEADQAFFNIANAFCYGDREKVIAIWQRSRLSEREKGKRADYIERTLNAAQRTYTGSKTRSKRRRVMVDVVKEPERKHRKQ